MPTKKQLVKTSQSSEDDTESLLAKLSELPPVEIMGPMQALVTAPGNRLLDNDLKDFMQKGSASLYEGLAPKDSKDHMLAMLAVSVTNLTLDCLLQAANAKPEWLEGRDLNLRYGLKGAVVATELIKTLDARRGNPQPKVSVGSVNVEAGGQAIVGNLEAPRSNEKAEPSASDAAEVHKPKTARRR